MKSGFLIGVTLLLATTAQAGDRMFSAADVPAAGIRKQGKIVIRNDRRSITAYHFFGDVREALFSLRSRPRIASRPFGAVLFDSSASVTQIPAHLSGVIADAARTHGVDPRLVAAVALRESAWDPQAVSPVGACGLMQLMPATARYLGVTNVFDLRQNVGGGTRYLRTLLDTFNGDLDLALAAYNAGPGAVLKYSGVPPYRETRAYVAAIRKSYEAALKN